VKKENSKKMESTNFVKYLIYITWRSIPAGQLHFFKKKINKGSNLPSLFPKEFLQLSHRQFMEHPTPFF
jgi:hypothetical protein